MRSLIPVVLLTSVASADPTSGVDSALFRPSYDPNGLFAVEGARLLPAHDLAFKLLMGAATSPIEASVPGIGDDKSDKILGAIGMNWTTEQKVKRRRRLYAMGAAVFALFGAYGGVMAGILIRPSL